MQKAGAERCLNFGARDLARPDGITLHICTRCRDGRETADGERGGVRLADAVLTARASRHDLPRHEILGVRCMSQCKRPCVVALSAPARFTYIFGDLDPERDAVAVLDTVALYAGAPEGFMPREQRPAALRGGVLGRVPPLGLATELVVSLASFTADTENAS